MAGNYDQDYDPHYNMNAMPKSDIRLANAADYAAHQLGKISRNLERLIAILEKGRKVAGVQFSPD